MKGHALDKIPIYKFWKMVDLYVYLADVKFSGN